MTALNSSNFQILVPQIVEKISRATFVSIDAEYSGLRVDGVDNVSLFDTPAERYIKLREVVRHQKSPQFGLSLFFRDSDPTKNLYHVEAWNISLLEPAFATFTNQPIMSYDRDCIQFFCKIGFDFNELLIDHYGAPFLNQQKRKALEEYLDKYPDFMVRFSEDFYYDPVIFPKVIPLMGESDKQELVDKLLGITKIIDAISKFKIPLIAHNMILDLLFLYHQFCDDLPNDYKEFKHEISKLFHVIYDTKYMTVCARKMLNHKTLAHVQCDKKILEYSGLFIMYQKCTSLLRSTSHFPLLQLAESLADYEKCLKIGEGTDLDTLSAKETSCHEAAFDAIVAGAIFLYLSHISARINREFSLRELPPNMEEVFTNTRAWQHQIYLARATVPHIYLLGHDPQPNRPNWFVVSAVNDTTINVDELMQKLGEIGPFDINSISSTEVYVAAASGKIAPLMKQRIRDLGYRLEIKIIPHERHQYDVIRYESTKSPRFSPLPS